MKPHQFHKNEFVFHIGERGKRLLFDILKLYPLIPAADQRISIFAKRTGLEASQHMLEEALVAHRQEIKKQVLAMLSEPARFQETKSGFRFTLSAPQMEWLLQVLNDIRVGSWINLGSPDMEKRKEIPLNEKTVPHLRIMEAAGRFEMALLDALNGQRRK